MASWVRADKANQTTLALAPTSSTNMDTVRFLDWRVGTLPLPVGVRHGGEGSLPMLSPRAL